MRRKYGIQSLKSLLPLLLVSGETGTIGEHGPLKVTMLKVGKADAIVLEQDGKALLIDTGEEDDGEDLVDFLFRENVKEIECLIITHYDKDHVGGADTLIRTLPVKKAILPDYDSVSSEYREFLREAEKSGSELIRLNEDCEFNFGGCRVEIEVPSSFADYDPDLDNDNDLSLITIVTYGEHRLLFMGDSEKKRLNEWLAKDHGQFTFMKFPHHGVYNSALGLLLSKTQPEYIAICDSKKNPADKETLELLEGRGTVFETKDGNILLRSNGREIEFTQN